MSDFDFDFSFDAEEEGKKVQEFKLLPEGIYDGIVTKCEWRKDKQERWELNMMIQLDEKHGYGKKCVFETIRLFNPTSREIALKTLARLSQSAFGKSTKFKASSQEDYLVFKDKYVSFKTKNKNYNNKVTEQVSYFIARDDNHPEVVANLSQSTQESYTPVASDDDAPF